jgi:hypothetical protein
MAATENRVATAKKVLRKSSKNRLNTIQLDRKFKEDFLEIGMKQVARVNDERGERFILSVLKEFEHYYMIGVANSSLMFANKTFDLFLSFGYVKPAKPTVDYLGSDFIIQLDTVVSLRKGEGRKALCRLVDIADSIGVNMSLWIEEGNEQVISYYEQFDFELTDHRGDDNNYLMMRKNS